MINNVDETHAFPSQIHLFEPGDYYVRRGRFCVQTGDKFLD